MSSQEIAANRLSNRVIDSEQASDAEVSQERSVSNKVQDMASKIETIPINQELTLLGGEALKASQMLEKAKTQEKRLNDACFGEHIDMKVANQLVGYTSKHCRIDFQSVECDVTALMPNRSGKDFYLLNAMVKFDRLDGTFSFYQKSGRRLYKINKEEGSGKEQLFVACLPKVVRSGEQRQDVRQNRFKESAKHSDKDDQEIIPTQYRSDELQRKEQWFSENYNAGKQRSQIEFPMQLVSSIYNYLLFFQTREDRDAVLYELNLHCLHRQSTLLHNVNRGNMIALISPVPSFNAMSLSQATMPIRVAQSTFELSGSMTRTSGSNQGKNLRRQKHVIEATGDYVKYFREGVKCFISSSVRQELLITDGFLIKEPREYSRLKPRFYKTFVSLDFQFSLLRFKKGDFTFFDDKYVEFKAGKDIPFSEVLEVSLLELDVFKQEHKVPEKQLPYRHKFLLRTINREYFFFAKSEVEREIWVKSFEKIVQQNRGKKGRFNMKASISMERVKNLSSAHQAFIGKRNHSSIQHGNAEIYKSQDLRVTQFGIQGKVMKAVENVGLFNKDKYHERYFKLQFSEEFCYICVTESSASYKHKYEQNKIQECKILDDAEVQEKVQEREDKRSNSFLRRMFHKEIKQCGWNFGFSLKFPDRTYELYAANKADRDQWVRILGTIAQMNASGIDVQEVNVIVFLKEMEEKKAKIQRESLMTVEQKQHAQEEEAEQKVLDNVALWFKINSSELEQKATPFKDYRSAKMSLNRVEALGKCFKINIKQKNQKQVHVFLDFPEEVLMIKDEANNQTVDKYTFSEILSVKPTGTQRIGSKDNPVLLYSFVIEMDLLSNIHLACEDENDFEQWIRCFWLIVKMIKLGIEPSKVNIFTFETHFKRQYDIYAGKAKKEVIESRASERLMSQSEKEATTEFSSKEQQIVALDKQLGRLECATMVRSYSCIEGYLWKEIDKKATIRFTKRHLRYFRIVFNSGKLNVKERKEDRQMKSFQLADLISISEVRVPASDTDFLSLKSGDNGILMEKYEIKKAFPVDQKEFFCSWPYSFKIEFYERSFTLSARTREEFQEWVRVFTLIDRMNKIGYAENDRNPFFFESQQQAILAPQQKHETDKRREETKQIRESNVTLGQSGPIKAQHMDKPSVINYNISVGSITTQNITNGGMAKQDASHRSGRQSAQRRADRNEPMIDGRIAASQTIQIMDDLLNKEAIDQRFGHDPNDMLIQEGENDNQQRASSQQPLERRKPHAHGSSAVKHNANRSVSKISEFGGVSSIGGEMETDELNFHHTRQHVEYNQETPIESPRDKQGDPDVERLNNVALDSYAMYDKEAVKRKKKAHKYLGMNFAKDQSSIKLLKKQVKDDQPLESQIKQSDLQNLDTGDSQKLDFYASSGYQSTLIKNPATLDLGSFTNDFDQEGEPNVRLDQSRLAANFKRKRNPSSLNVQEEYDDNDDFSIRKPTEEIADLKMDSDLQSRPNSRTLRRRSIVNPTDEDGNQVSDRLQKENSYGLKRIDQAESMPVIASDYVTHNNDYNSVTLGVSLTTELASHKIPTKARKKKKKKKKRRNSVVSDERSFMMDEEEKGNTTKDFVDEVTNVMAFDEDTYATAPIQAPQNLGKAEVVQYTAMNDFFAGQETQKEAFLKNKNQGPSISIVNNKAKKSSRREEMQMKEPSNIRFEADVVDQLEDISDWE